jgi:hypothetical protein
VRSARCQTIVICRYALQTVHIIIAEHNRLVTFIVILYYYKVRIVDKMSSAAIPLASGQLRVVDGISPAVHSTKFAPDAAAAKND